MKSGFVYGKTYRAILIGLLITLAILAGILTYYINEINKLTRVTNLIFPEDEWMKVNSATIYSKDSIVSPNDELLLQLDITNKKPMRWEIEPKIYIDVGGDIFKKKEDIGKIQLGINYTGILSYTFFAASEGQNNIKVALAISDFNGTFIKYENATANFPVLSTNDKLLHDQNNAVLLGVVVSGLVGLGALVFTAIQTLKLREERNLTLRAWIGDIGSKFTIKNVINAQGVTKTYDEWKNMPSTEKQQFNLINTEIHFLVKNFGIVPAVDVRGRLFTNPNEEPSSEQINSTEFGDPFVIMPGGEKVIRFFLAKESSEYFLDPISTSFASLEIKYKSANSNKERLYGMSFMRKGDGFSVLNAWDEGSRK